MNEKRKRLVLGLVCLIVICPLLYLGISLGIREGKYDSVKETNSGAEISLIADEYINAYVSSAEWDREVLECTKKDVVETGCFAGRLRKQFFVFKGVNSGKTEIAFTIQKFGKEYRKAYEVEVSDDYTVNVLSVDEAVVEKIILNQEDTDKLRDAEEPADTENDPLLNTYIEIVKSIDEQDGFSVAGYELAYIDEDENPELVVSADYFGNVLFMYTAGDGEVTAYSVCEEWFTVDDPLGSEIYNGLDLGQGNGYQSKEVFYLPHSGNICYVYSESDDYGNLTEKYYCTDGASWKEIGREEFNTYPDSGWVKLNFHFGK